MSDPFREYRARHESWMQRLEESQVRSERFGNLRLFAFFFAVAVLLGAWMSEAWSAYWSLLPLALFFTLIIRHQPVIAAKEKADRGTAYYRVAEARLSGDWSAPDPDRDRAPFDPKHLFAADLDLISPPGDRSVLHLVSSARTVMGTGQLAKWLTSTSDPGEILRRQEAVRELRPNVDLFEHLGLMESDIGETLDPEALKKWVSRPPFFPDFMPRAITMLLTLAAIVTLIAAFFPGVGIFPLLIVFGLEIAFSRYMRELASRAAEPIERSGQSLFLLQRILDLIDRQKFEAPLLAESQTGLRSGGRPPAEEVREIGTLIHRYHNSRRNQFAAVIWAPFLRSFHLLFAIEDWRLRAGKGLPEWLDAVGEFEALLSLARHGYEHPEDPMPEIVKEGPRFDAEGLGHPLLTENICVRNDICLDADNRLFLVSGSNMSGKSTLLRSIGCNAALALAGGPVRARALRISPLDLGASIRILDSLEEGRSRFYSELSRIQGIVAKSKSHPTVLFLLDELLHGTNSHDRQVGAKAVLKTLLDNGAIGLITTHDLALCKLGEELGPAVKNVHFQDDFTDGKMTFDYKLREGVVKKSNALDLMRLEL